MWTRYSLLPTRDETNSPALLFLWSASNGDISGMKYALEMDPDILFQCDFMSRSSALHCAAQSRAPTAVKAIEFLLKRGIPWSSKDADDHIAEQVAQRFRNEDSRKFLREWALRNGKILSLNVNPGYYPASLFFCSA
jgi:hypothetical protein